MKIKSKKVATRGILLLMMVVAMVAYYYYLSNKEKVLKESNTKLTASQEVLARDLENNYPNTPKEVIRYYSEITKCFYNEEHSAGEMNALASKARELYDEELLENNEWGQYMIQLQDNVDSYKEQEMSVSSYSVAASTDVEYYASGGMDYAKIRCAYMLKQKSAKKEINELFVLRKDDKGHWKILGWELADKVDENTDESINEGQ